MRLLAEELLLCSPSDPGARFTAWQALERNKVIYALAAAALVVEAETGKAARGVAPKSSSSSSARCRSIRGVEVRRLRAWKPWAPSGPSRGRNRRM